MPLPAPDTTTPTATRNGLTRFLPRIGSPGYHLMLAAVALLVLGPLGGISAAFMNFSIGFFIGGQVLAGILGSTVTLPYGPEGKHGANYMQTMAASVAGMCGMGVLMQAMIWVGLPQPATWQLILYFTCIGMFGVGIGMLYTPVVVDRMQLAFPSGFAVANILRALTDKNLLKNSILKLGGGILGGYGWGLLLKWAALWAQVQGLFHFLFTRVPGLSSRTSEWMTSNSLNLITGFSASTFGAGMIVGARIALPALVVALLGDRLKPYLVSIGWLEAKDPFRKIGFIIALGTILGAAIVDVSLILFQAVRRFRQQGAASPPAEDWKRVNMTRLICWVVFWGAGVVIVGSSVLQQPVFFLLVAVALCFLFVLINGISIGISDSNPISSAFVMTVFILASLGLKDPGVGLMCGSILLISCSLGGDMQQDRSTGWRLGTNRIVQFRYQVLGVAMGAVLAVALAKIFMTSYPVLQVNQIQNQDVPGVQQWQSAMTYKFVGALNEITHPQPHVMKALQLGIGLGLGIEIGRKLLKRSRRYQAFARSGPGGRTTEFVVDSFVLASPYASSFGGFVDLLTTIWWAAGGLTGTIYENWNQRRKARKAQPAEGTIPADMSTTSLVGGGLIAGDSLAALSIGIYMLLKTLVSTG